MLGAYRAVSFEAGDNAVAMTQLEVSILDYDASSWTLSYRVSAVNTLTNDVDVSATIWWRNGQDMTLTRKPDATLVRASSSASIEGVFVMATALAEQLDPARTWMEWSWRGVNP
jgi:hypothetical protein